MNIKEILKMSEYIDLAYPVHEEMPIYPGLPKTQVKPREDIEKGDEWNGSVISMYTHAGTHCDAPYHFIEGGSTIDNVPISHFVYKNPVYVETKYAPDYKVSIEDLKSAGKELYNADIIFINTGAHKLRDTNFDKYSNNYPALSVEAAEFIRDELPNLKAVAIDTISIEDLSQGKELGYPVHRGLMKEEGGKSIVIFEDYNPKPIEGKKILSAFAAPLRIKGRDASPVNIVVEYEN